MIQLHLFPPFNEETAIQKIQKAEDAWNSKDPIRISKAYTLDTEWRNRNQFINGRKKYRIFLLTNGKMNWITNLKNNFGHLTTIVLL